MRQAQEKPTQYRALWTLYFWPSLKLNWKRPFTVQRYSQTAIWRRFRTSLILTQNCLPWATFPAKQQIRENIRWYTVKISRALTYPTLVSSSWSSSQKINMEQLSEMSYPLLIRSRLSSKRVTLHRQSGSIKFPKSKTQTAMKWLPQSTWDRSWLDSRLTLKRWLFFRLCHSKMFQG